MGVERPGRRWVAAAMSLVTVVAGFVVGAGSVARAEPGCQTGGELAIFVRGSGRAITNPPTEAAVFFSKIGAALQGTPFGTLELGDQDGNGFQDSNGYPAVDAAWAVVMPDYYNVSASTGVLELFDYLNRRVLSCPHETTVIGAFSQGAQVVGDTLPMLNQNVLNHIGYVALYGDPKFNVACGQDRWWVRLSNGCTGGILGARNPYMPSVLRNRVGSWCANDDAICSSNPVIAAFGGGSHSSVYQNTWISASASLIASATRSKVQQLNPPSVYAPPGYVPPPAPGSPPGSPPPPPPALPNLWFVKTHNTGSGRIEVHNAAPTGYMSGPVHSTTRFIWVDQDKGVWQMVGPDLWFIKTTTDNGMVEVHSATAASGYYGGVSYATYLNGAVDASKGVYRMSGNTVFFVKLGDTGSGMVELHAATAASNYQSGQHSVTRFSPADRYNGVWQMVGGDLWFIKTRNTSSGRVEIHIATAASGYQSGPDVVTWFSPADQDNGSWQILGHDLYFVKTHSTPGDMVEVHSMTESSGYWEGMHTTTYLNGAVDGNNGWWWVG